MRSQACEPCAKRKVRCDREEPCSNCKRRKQDRCNYPELSPVDRIKKLEALVRSLGGNPDDDILLNSHRHSTAFSPAAPSTRPTHVSHWAASCNDGRSKDPVILEEDGQQYYLESHAWLVHHHRENGGNHDEHAKYPLLLRNAPHAFQIIFCSRQSSKLTTPKTLQDNAQLLWTTFKQRVHPFIRISFRWELEHLESSRVHPQYEMHVGDAEDALVSSIYLASIISLSDAECRNILHQSRTPLLSEYQIFCEEALAGTNILCMKNIQALKAVVIYLAVSVDRLSTQSLWSLMGLAVRNAEKLGIHRDGTVLGLSPSETEERRRLWWQLQYLDLMLAIRLGATPLTLMADWDVKLPLNIEDEDITPDMKSFPQERKGLTSMSYCLFSYYGLHQQRQYRASQGGFELSWSTNQSVPMQVKEAFVDRLEDGLNKAFLQYCDPIKPLDILLQLVARSLICVLRQQALLRSGENPSQMSHEHRGPLLATSMQALEYTIVMHSHQLLKDFQWLTVNLLPWHAFMIVLVEASHETDMDKCQRIWTLLSDLYAANASLFELVEDRRRLHAAELVVSAWKTRQSKDRGGQSSLKPDFVTNLENRLMECLSESTQRSNLKDGTEEIPKGAINMEIPQGLSMEQDVNALFDLDFQDIDWSFWSSID